jgi:dienelactone hydrolase
MTRRHCLALLTLLPLLACLRRPRPQEPISRPYPHRSFGLRGPAGDLAGELVLPEGPGPFPAVLLLAGSGPQDRDVTVAGHRLFLFLSDALAREGIASLRFDKRGVGASQGDFASATITDFALDAGAAFDALAATPGIDPRRIAMLGHSEGGLTAALAAQGRDVAALVLMAGPAVGIDQILRQQTRRIAQLQGASQARIAALDDALAASFTALRQARNISEARPALTAALAPLPLDVREAYAALLVTPWAHDALRHDPLALVAAFDGPVLALFGGTDTQVDAEQNAAALRGLRGLRIDIREGLNHLFQPDATGNPANYAEIEMTMAPEVPAAIVQFLRLQSGFALGRQQ